jgi:valyl-tRNA synthetase
VRQISHAMRYYGIIVNIRVCVIGKFISMSTAALTEEQRDVISRECLEPLSAASLQSLPLAERYICSRCHEVVQDVSLSLDKFHFSEAGRVIYDFLWDEFADWYIEVTLVGVCIPSRNIRWHCTASGEQD